MVSEWVIEGHGTSLQSSAYFLDDGILTVWDYVLLWDNCKEPEEDLAIRYLGAALPFAVNL